MRIIRLGLAAGLLLGCNAFDEPGVSGDSKLVRPTDVRSVQQALTTPPPISGGTLAIDPEGTLAVAADPARDRVSVVRLLGGRDVTTIELEDGDEPGRVAIDGAGRAHVALRGSGELASIDLSAGELVGRRAVCSAPRGVTYDASQDLVHVACADGRLVSLPADGGGAARELQLETDLRDVLVRPAGLAVSRFKSAEVLSLDGEGALASRVAPPSMSAIRDSARIGSFEEVRSTPHVAWRMTSDETTGAVVMLHQHEMDNEIDIDSPPPETAVGAGSSYGGGGQTSGFGVCSGVVQSSVAIMQPNFGVMSANISGSVLAVDIAVEPSRQVAAIAQAGLADPESPESFTIFRDQDNGDAVAMPARPPSAPVLMVQLDDIKSGTQCVHPEAMEVDGQATAVAFTPRGELVIQTREPARLFVGSGQSEPIELGGDSIADTGHDIFHRDAGDGIACASCHAEGGDDGHTWKFSGIGERRTQAVDVGLEGTAPFHWDGDMADLGHLMSEVFVGRMGGVPQSGERLGALGEWLFAQRPPAPIVAEDHPAALRGKEIFESAEVGCVQCHSGEKFTRSDSFYVGTTADDHPLQVPSLRGVGYRAPFIHNGCASTLRERFDPDCGGGDLHGQTSQLDSDQLDDLVAYLQSL